MSQPAVFRATVQSYRSAASRGMFQIVLEVPEEQTPEVTTIAPRGSWVAVAALSPEGAAPATSGQEREVSAPPAPLKPSDKPGWSKLPLSQQAAIRCGDPVFRKWLEEKICHRKVNTHDESAAVVRHYCGIESRADLDVYPVPAVKWQDLENRYSAWRIADKVGALT